MSAHDAVAPVAVEAPPSRREAEPSASGGQRVQLRALSYSDGQHALTPPPDAGAGVVQRKQDDVVPEGGAGTSETSTTETNTSTTETSASTTETSTVGESENETGTSTGTTTTVTPETTSSDPTQSGDTPGGDGNKDDKPKSEEEQVAETHAMTLGVLEDKIVELSGATQKVFAFRKKAKAAKSAKEILFFLKGYDAQTITAAWHNVKAKCGEAFQDLIQAIGYKDAARLYPRESRATLAAHDDLKGFAEGCVKKNPYAAMMAVTLMGEADRTAFIAAHPGFDASLSEVDRESLSADAFFGKEAALRKGEEAYRKKQVEGVKAEAEDSEKAKEAAETESGKKLIEETQALVGAGKYAEALVLIGNHGSESEARAAVRKLDAIGQVAALLGALSFDEKWNTYPLHMRKLLSLRSPEVNIADAYALFPDIPRKTNKKGKVKGAQVRKSPLTSEQAYAIFQFMKALPAAHRAQFQKAYPSHWEEMNVHMNASMKDADDTNFVGAHGEDEEAIAGLLAQLESDEFWLASPVQKMTGTLKLILAAGHRASIGARLQALAQGSVLGQVYSDAARRSAIESVLGLTGDPKQIPPEGTPEERAAAWLGCLKLEQKISTEDDKPKLRIFKALGALTHANRETRKEIREEKKEWREKKKNGEEVGEEPDREKPNLLKQAFNRDGVKVENLAVDELEDMTTSKKGNEDLFGLDFKDIDRSGGDKDNKDRNRVDANFNANEGTLVFTAPTLELDSVRFPAGDLLVQTGPVLMRNLHLDVRWPTPHNRNQKQRVVAEANLIDAQGIMITGPGIMASIGHVGAQKIEFILEEEEVDYSDNPDASQILALVAKHNPARGLIGGLMSGRFTESTGELAKYLGGFPGGSQGGIQLEVGSIVVEGVQVGADTYVDKASVDGIALTYDTRPSVHFEARLRQLAGMIDDAKTQLAGLGQGTLSETDAHKKGRLEGDIDRWGEEQTRLQADIPNWQTKEQLYQDIFELHRLLGADAQKAASDERVTLMRQRARSLGYQVSDSAALGDILQIIHADLSHHAGATFSVDNVNVKGVEAGGNKVEEANVKGIDVSGEGDALASSLDTKTVKRLGGKGSQDKAGNYVSSEVTADVGEVDVKGVSIGGGAPMAKALVKTRDKYHALEKKTDKKGLEQTQFQALDAQWKTIVADGRTYGEVAEQMASLWELHGEGIKRDQQLLSEFKACEKALSGHPITVESISVSGISVQSGTSDASASTVDGKPVTVTNAHSKVSIGEVEAENANVGGATIGSASVTGIAVEAEANLESGPDGKMKPVSGKANVTVESARAKDVKAGGTTVSEVGAEDIGVNVTSGPDGSEAELHVGKVYAKGVGLEQGKKTAEDKKAALQEEIKRRQQKGEPYADLEAQLHAVEDGLAKYTQAYADQETLLAEVKTIDGQIDAQKKKLDAAKREAAVKKHKNTEAAKKQDKARIQAIQDEIARLSAQRDDVKKKLGEPQQIIAAYEGTLGIAGEVSLENIDVKVSGLPNLEQLEKLAKGDASADLSGVYGLELALGPLTIPAIDYAAPTMRVALGGAKMPSLKAAAKVGVERVEATDGKPPSHRVKSLEVDQLVIPEVSGSGLNLVMGVEGEQVRIELPTVSLKGLALTGVKLPGLDAEALKTAEGKFNLTEVSASMSAKVGDSMKANGNLSLKGVHAEALSSGAVNFGLGDLTLDKLGFDKVDKKDKKGGGSIVTQILSIGGKATKLGKLTVEGSYDRVTSELATTVGLGELTLSGVNYAGGGAQLGVGYAAMKGVSVTVAAKFKQGDVPEGESKIESLWLNKLHIDSLAGRNIDYDGKGQKRERFGDGTEKVTAIEQHIGLKAGTLYGIDVGRMRIDGDGDKSLSLSLGSGKVNDLDLWMKKNGQQVLSAHASAKVEGVSVSLVDDDLHLGIDKFQGSANVKVGTGDNQTALNVSGVSVDNTNVDIENLGDEKNQVTTATVDAVTAKQIDFAMGIKGADVNTAHGLGGAQLKGVTFRSDAAKTSVDIASGSGALVAGANMVGKTSGNYDPKDPNAQKKDEFRAPMYKVDYDITALDNLNGQTKLLYPDGKTFLHLNIVNGVVKLDVTDNIRQMWSSWWKDIKGEDLSSWGLDMDAWGKRIQAIRDIDNNAFYTLLLKGVELAFNQWGESLTGGWSNIAKSVVGMLNADPKTKLFEAKPMAFATFQESLNESMTKYVDEGIKTVLDYGMLYDLGKGEYGRAASDAGLWLVEWFGETVGWDAADEWAEEKREAYNAEREAELRKIVANFVSYITSGGIDMKLASKDGKLSAKKTPLAGGDTKQLLSSLLDVDVAGGGSLKGGIAASARGTLRDFHFSDAGNSIDMTKLTFGAGAQGKGNVGFDEKTSRFTQADLDLVGGTFIEFEGLHFETDKTFQKDALPEGVRTTKDQQAEHGNKTSGNGPVTNGNTIRYDAGQYSEMMQNGEDPAGPNYTTKLKMGDKVKAGAMGLVSEEWSEEFKNKTIAAQNAEVFGRYAPKGSASKP